MRLQTRDAGILARRAAGGLLLGLGVVAVAGWVLRRIEIRFVVYEALPWPNGPWLAVSLLAFGAALVVSIPVIWRTTLVILGCGGAAAAVLWLMVAPWIGAGRGTEDQSYAAPNASYRLVVHQGGFFDPIYFLSIEQETGPLPRSWYLGCLDGDYDWIEEARWESPGLFSARTSGQDGLIRIHVDPASGRPSTPPFPHSASTAPEIRVDAAVPCVSSRRLDGATDWVHECRCSERGGHDVAGLADVAALRLACPATAALAAHRNGGRFGG